jgi:hypothetical protein
MRQESSDTVNGAPAEQDSGRQTFAVVLDSTTGYELSGAKEPSRLQRGGVNGRERPSGDKDQVPFGNAIQLPATRQTVLSNSPTLSDADSLDPLAICSVLARILDHAKYGLKIPRAR